MTIDESTEFAKQALAHLPFVACGISSFKATYKFDLEVSGELGVHAEAMVQGLRFRVYIRLVGPRV